MKPKTKLQHEVLSLSKQLPKINKVLEKWTFKSVIDHKAFRTKKATSCLSCGHIWSGLQGVAKDVCPSCKRTLAVTDSLKKKDKQMVYVAFIDVKDRFQVNRFFQMYCYSKAGQKPEYWLWEVAQQWLDPDGKNECVARGRGGMGWNMDNNWHGFLEIRDRGYLNGKYDVFADAVYPKMKVLPIYEKHGFGEGINNCYPFSVMNAITTDSMCETLIKAKQFALLNTRISRPTLVEKYWNSVKICMRNKYIVTSGTTWVDYLDLLVHFGRDIHNPKYVCPADLKRAHDRLVSKKRSIERKKEIAQLKKELKANNAKYKKNKKAFFGLVFKDGDLIVKVLESVEEFMKEGDTHQHCVFTNSYFNKPDSLVFSAQIKGEPIETVELSLSKMKLLQARGAGNEPTSHHRRIINLVNRNIKAVKERYESLKTA